MVICDYIRLVWQSETVHLGEPVRTNINQSFIYQRVYHFTEPRERSDFRYGVEVNQFLSYNLPLKAISAKQPCKTHP